MRYQTEPLEALARGSLVNLSIMECDAPMAFVMRELEETDLPPNGRWWRFDLGRIKLGRPNLTLDLPSGAVVQAAYAEHLAHGRVFPHLANGGGADSCLMDTWVARGGEQVFRPLHPKGGRFIEVHVIADPEMIRWLDGSFTERSYYGGLREGGFECDDARLNRIWETGVDTLDSCAEDAITDNPTRERGQWLGDATGPGLEIICLTQRDHRPLLRGFRQAALCATPAGLIPAVFPGTREYLPSFAIQWVTAIPRYYRLSGNLGSLVELFPAARGVVDFFRPHQVPGGLKRIPGCWNFIDWGYSGASDHFGEHAEQDEDCDRALSLLFLRACRSLADWAEIIGKPTEEMREETRRLEREIRSEWLSGFRSDLGFHVAALALGEGLFDVESSSEAVAAVKAHILDCFPNNPQAPRLESVHVRSSRLITPYFLNFVLPTLIHLGEEDFVYDTIRTCWGWMLDAGATTWYEVFDRRWSHCHQWSGCPTWLLTRFALGLSPCLDKQPHRFRFDPRPGSLARAAGRLPHPTGGHVRLSWHRTGGSALFVEYAADHPIALESAAGALLAEGRAWSGRVVLEPAGASS
jgi:hypothetical protein